MISLKSKAMIGVTTLVCLFFTGCSGNGNETDVTSLSTVDTVKGVEYKDNVANNSSKTEAVSK